MKQTKQQFKNFAEKLAQILDDPKLTEIIKKNEKNSIIYIVDEDAFTKQVLPYFFKHDRLDSFYRQLHLYGFKKIRKTNFPTFFHVKLQQGFKVSELISIKKQQKLQKKRILKTKNQQRKKKTQEKKAMELNNYQEKKQKNGLQPQLNQLSSIGVNQEIGFCSEYNNLQNSFMRIYDYSFIPYCNTSFNYYHHVNPFQL